MQGRSQGALPDPLHGKGVLAGIRFGFGYVAEAFAARGVRVEVLEGPVAVDAAQELVADMLAIVTYLVL